MRLPRSISELIEDGLENAALAMEEGDLSVRSLSILGATERVCEKAFADRIVTVRESQHIRHKLAELRVSIDEQLRCDCRDLELARRMNGKIAEMGVAHAVQS